MSVVTGLHHVTAIAGDPQENLDFYAGRLGMRLVKRSVNQDVPGTYHLFYADGAGHPGREGVMATVASQPSFGLASSAANQSRHARASMRTAAASKGKPFSVDRCTCMK